MRNKEKVPSQINFWARERTIAYNLPSETKIPIQLSGCLPKNLWGFCLGYLLLFFKKESLILARNWSWQSPVPPSPSGVARCFGADPGARGGGGKLS